MDQDLVYAFEYNDDIDSELRVQILTYIDDLEESVLEVQMQRNTIQLKLLAAEKVVELARSFSNIPSLKEALEEYDFFKKI